MGMRANEIRTELKADAVAGSGIPQYLRFDCIRLHCKNLRRRPPYEGTIGERFEWVQMILQPFKHALTGSKFDFLGTINKAQSIKTNGVLREGISKALRRFSTTSTNYFKFLLDLVLISSILNRTLAGILQQMFLLQFFNSMQSFFAQRLRLNLILEIQCKRVCPSKPLETGSIALMDKSIMNAFLA